MDPERFHSLYSWTVKYQ